MCACITTKWLIIIVTIITISVGSGMNYLLKPIVFHLSKKESKTPQMGDLEIDIHDFQIFSFSPFDKLQLQFMGRMI